MGQTLILKSMRECRKSGRYGGFWSIGSVLKRECQRHGSMAVRPVSRANDEEGSQTL